MVLANSNVFGILFTLLQPEALETILNCCTYGGKLVVTDILEANLEGELPLDNLRSSTFKPQHDYTILEGGNEADATASVEETDFGKSMKNQEAHLKAVSLLSYLGKRPKLVSFCNYVGINELCYIN